MDAEFIRQVAEEIRSVIGDDDQETFLDTLDGETDAMDLLEAMLLEYAAAGAREEGCKKAARMFTDRSKRATGLQEMLRSQMQRLLVAMGQRKVLHPLGTVSIRKGTKSVIITAPEDVPTQMCRVKTEPDKTAIKASLEAGEKVPGAQLTTGPDSLSVRFN